MWRFVGGELVFVHVRDGGVVLGKQSKDDGGGTGGEVVNVVEREWSNDEDEKERWK